MPEIDQAPYFWHSWHSWHFEQCTERIPCLMHHAPSTMAEPAAARGVAPAGGRYRWIVCALLFVAATINYIDRQVIGILKPTLQQEFGWSEIDYADIVFAF